MTFLKALMVFALLFMSSCQQNESVKKVLHYSMNQDPSTLDPRKCGDLPATQVSYLLFAGLVDLQPNGEVTLALAKAYDISKDNKTYTFHLKEAFWSDGHKITAYDFEKSWKSSLSPSFPALWVQNFSPLKNGENIIQRKMESSFLGVKAIDENTLSVELENSTPHFLTLATFLNFFPIPSHIIENDPDWAKWPNPNFINCGPYKLESWQHHNELVFKKNEKYWNAKSVKIDEIHIAIISDENTSLEMYKRGELDILGTTICPIPFDSLESVKMSSEFCSYPVASTIFCSFNTRKVPFNNKNIRKAFSLAINRANIVQHINKTDEIATRLISPVLCKNKNRQLVEDFNEEKAKKLFEKGLEELGINKEELNLTFCYGSFPLHKKQALALQEGWNKTFGIKVKLEQMEEKSIIDHFHKHEYQFGLRFWMAQYFDPLSILERFKFRAQPKNYPAWENEEYITILDEASKTNDLQKREELLNRAEEIFIEEIPLTPICHMSYSILKKPFLKNVQVGALGSIYLEKMDIER